MRALRRFFFESWSRAAVTRGNDRRSDPTDAPAWRSVYSAALLETDEEMIAKRIAEAKSALVTRARELFVTSEDHLQEESAIDEAFQVLHALEKYAAHVSGCQRNG